MARPASSTPARSIYANAPAMRPTQAPAGCPATRHLHHRRACRRARRRPRRRPRRPARRPAPRLRRATCLQTARMCARQWAPTEPLAKVTRHCQAMFATAMSSHRFLAAASTSPASCPHHCQATREHSNWRQTMRAAVSAAVRRWAVGRRAANAQTRRGHATQSVTWVEIKAHTVVCLVFVKVLRWQTAAASTMTTRYGRIPAPCPK